MGVRIGNSSWRHKPGALAMGVHRGRCCLLGAATMDGSEVDGGSIEPGGTAKGFDPNDVSKNEPVGPEASPVPETAPLSIEEAKPPVVPRIRLDKKHPLALRWVRWVNFPV